MTPSGLGLDRVENLLLDGGDGDLMEGGGGDSDLLVGGLRGGRGGGDGDLVVGILRGGCSDGDLLVGGLRGGCSDGDLPVVNDDGARAVFSIAPRSGEDAYR